MSRRRGWAYHLVTIGVALVMVVVTVLVAAAVGAALGRHAYDVEPGRGVTPIPAPQQPPPPPR